MTETTTETVATIEDEIRAQERQLASLATKADAKREELAAAERAHVDLLADQALGASVTESQLDAARESIGQTKTAIVGLEAAHDRTEALLAELRSRAHDARTQALVDEQEALARRWTELQVDLVGSAERSQALGLELLALADRDQAIGIERAKLSPEGDGYARRRRMRRLVTRRDTLSAPSLLEALVRDAQGLELAVHADAKV
jgi:hypothetical protein